jgi:hypothetical protein
MPRSVSPWEVQRKLLIKAEDKTRRKIEGILSQKAESETDDLPDSEHGYVDALLWIQEGSIQLTLNSIKKEMEERKYADRSQSEEYYNGYESGLASIFKMLAEKE